MTRALITWGGWMGHEPDKVAEIFRALLTSEGFQVEVYNTLDCFADVDHLKTLDLIVPIWTMSQIDKQLVQNVSEAVSTGTGLAGCHGGMCDTFRDNVLWQFMTGGNWVAHPGGDGVDYSVNLQEHPLNEGLADFSVSSEQYYLHVDPAVEVFATTRFPSVNWLHSTNRPVDMPVAWTKRWGLVRVYYNALGHHADVIDHGTPLEMIRRGMLWAAEGKAEAAGQSIAHLANDANNY